MSCVIQLLCNMTYLQSSHGYAQILDGELHSSFELFTDINRLPKEEFSKYLI